MKCSRNPKQRNAPRASSAPRASKTTSSRAQHLHAQRDPRRIQVHRLGQRKPPLCAMQSPGSSQSFTHTRVTRPSAPCASRTLRNRPRARQKGRNSINQPAACSSSRAERAAPSHLTRFQVASLRASLSAAVAVYGGSLSAACCLLHPNAPAVPLGSAEAGKLRSICSRDRLTGRAPHGECSKNLKSLGGAREAGRCVAKLSIWPLGD